MPSDKVYKSFTARPLACVNTDYESRPLADAVDSLVRDVRTVTSLAEYHLRSDDTLLDDLDAYISSGGTGTPRKIMQRIGVRLPSELRARRTGASRFEHLYQDRVGREALSWLERRKARDGVSDKYVSQGWQRTAHGGRPQDLTPKVSLSTIDKQYARIEMLGIDRFILWVVVEGSWCGFVFVFDAERFDGCSKLCLPDVVVTDNGLRFHFAVEYAYEFHDVSETYIVGVDVGVTDTLHAVVARTTDGDVVEHTRLSPRAHGLANSIRASLRQVVSLRKCGRHAEASLHRQAVSRKRRELAVIAGQEVADLAARWDNALVVVEDLSHIRDTMKFGRWNRGEVVRWVTHFTELNGSRVVRINAAYTSKTCHRCGSPLTFTNYRHPRCTTHGEMHRDVNAAANIALRAVDRGTLSKVVQTRKKSKRFTGTRRQRSVKPVHVLKYPGRDRTKTAPTPSRSMTRKYAGEVNTSQRTVTSHTVHIVVADAPSIRMGETLERRRETVSTPLRL